MFKESQANIYSLTETTLVMLKISALPLAIWGVEDLIRSIIFNNVNLDLTSLAVKGSLRIIAAVSGLIATNQIQLYVNNNLK